MREYQSTHTGQEVDIAISKVLQNVGIGDSSTPLYVNDEGDMLAISKLSTVEEGSEFLVTSDGIYRAIQASGSSVDSKIADAEERIFANIDTVKSELESEVSRVEGELGSINQELTDRVNNLDRDKQDTLVAGEGINIEGNTISTVVAPSEWGMITGTLDDQEDLAERLQQIKDIAEGRTSGAVFDDVAGMNAYIAEKQAAGEEIPVGFTFFIRDINSPNYWWDGEKAIESGQQKIDLTDYATKVYVNNTVGNATKNYVNDTVDSLGATKQDKLEVIQLYKD